MKRSMDVVSKNRLIGAIIWLGLLVLVVPQWYSEPVNFVPDGGVTVESKITMPIVDHAYRIPNSSDKPLTNGQQLNVDNQKSSSGQSLESTKIDETLLVDKTDFSEKHQNIQKLINKSEEIDSNKKYQGQWIVRLLAFSDIREANELLGRLDVEYDVYIKYYEKTKMYSVRTGPYISKAKADKDKLKLDKMLHTNGEVVQLP